MQCYTKTYHRQNVKFCISMVWKVITVFDVVTDTSSGRHALVVTHDKKAVDQFQLFPKEATQHPLNAGSS